MLEALLATLTVSGAVSTALAVRWTVVTRRRRARAEAVAALNDDSPLGDLSHLSPALARLLRQARVVRWVLATPLQRAEPPVLHETPWARRARCDQYDLALGDARRALWEWLLLLRDLDRCDREVLVGLGVSLAPFHGVLFRPGIFERSDDPWDQRLYPEAPDHEHVFAGLRRIMYDLRNFEFALQTAARDPYRC